MGNLIWILTRVRKPLSEETFQLNVITSLIWGNFSNSDFPSRMCCDFFRTTLFLEKLLLHTTFSEWLLRHKSYIFGAAIFWTFFSFFQNSHFFAAVIFLEKLLFQSENSTEQPLLENKKSLMPVTFRNSCFFPV